MTDVKLDTHWTELDINEGSFKFVFSSTKRHRFNDFIGKLVVKFPRSSMKLHDLELSDVLRAEQRHHQLNPELPIFAKAGYTIFLLENPPQDQEVKLGIIYLFCLGSNLRYTVKDKNGEIQTKQFCGDTKRQSSQKKAMQTVFKTDGEEELPFRQEQFIYKSTGLCRPYLIMPHLGNTLVSDEDTDIAIIDICRRTRIVIVDGDSNNNFLFYQNHAVCIDVDLAIDLTEENDLSLLKKIGVDLEFSWNNFIFSKAKTSETIRTLLYLGQQINMNDLKDEYITREVITALHAYRKRSLAITPNILNIIFSLTQIEPQHQIQHQIQHQDITPELIAAIEQHGNSSQSLTVDLVLKLIENCKIPHCASQPLPKSDNRSIARDPNLLFNVGKNRSYPLIGISDSLTPQMGYSSF